MLSTFGFHFKRFHRKEKFDESSKCGHENFLGQSSKFFEMTISPKTLMIAKKTLMIAKKTLMIAKKTLMIAKKTLMIAKKTLMIF